MPKLVEIDECNGCRYFDRDEQYCSKLGKLIRDMYMISHSIPPDCPLSDAPSESQKSEVAQCGMSIQECIDAIDKAIDIKAEHLKAIYEDMLAAMSGIKDDTTIKAQNCPKCGKHGDSQEFYSGGGYKAYTCNGCKTVWPVGINE